MGLGALALGSPLFAHTGASPDPGRPWWTHWNPDALTIANLFFLVAFYVSGLRQMRAQRGLEAPIRLWQVVAFGVGIVGLIVALLSPVDCSRGRVALGAQGAAHDLDEPRSAAGGPRRAGADNSVGPATVGAGDGSAAGGSS